jgi:hypothetical protein
MEDIKKNIKTTLENMLAVRNVVRDTYSQNPTFTVHKQFYRWSDGPTNWSQTKQGVFILEQYYGTFAYIISPIGRVAIDGVCGYNEDGTVIATEAIIHKELGLVLIQEGFQTQSGHFGPWYLVTKINGNDVDIPEQKLKLSMDSYLDKNNNLTYGQMKELFEPIRYPEK